MTVAMHASSVISADGTIIGWTTVGSGAPVLVVGGSMRTAEDYLPFAEVLATHFTVHVVDRRGRGASGPQGGDYSIEKEVEDLLAVQAATGARAAFGHSYGGLVVLEAARRAPVLNRLAVYEPGVSIGGSIPTGWMPRYRQLLSTGDARGAFACFVRGSGHAPKPVTIMPAWYLRAVLRVVIRAPQWRRMEPLLSATLAEHEQVATLDGTVAGYAAITAPTLLLGGSRSPSFTSADVLDALHRRVAPSTVEILDGLDHNAPDEKAPTVVAHRVLRFLQEQDPAALLS